MTTTFLKAIDVNVPLPSLGSVYGTRPSSLVVGKVEAGC